MMTFTWMNPMFQSTSTITLHPIKFGKSTFTYSCACQAEVAMSVESKLQSWNCKSYWNLKVSTRVAILESNYVSIYKLKPLYIVTCSFGRGFHCEGWKRCRAHIYTPKKNWWPKWHLRGVEDFKIEHYPHTFKPADLEIKEFYKPM